MDAKAKREQRDRLARELNVERLAEIDAVAAEIARKAHQWWTQKTGAELAWCGACGVLRVGAGVQRHYLVPEALWPVYADASQAVVGQFCPGRGAAEGPVAGPELELLVVDGVVVRVRLTGGELAEGWTVRPGREAWCEIVVRLDDGFVGSYGGEVWPGAWSDVFEVGAPTRDGAPVRMRPEWLARVRALVDSGAGARERGRRGAT